MPEAVFIVNLDEFQGFIVSQKYPPSIVLNERVLNLIFYELQKKKKEQANVIEIDGMRIVPYTDEKHPMWFVCFILGENEQYNEIVEEIEGMSRLILMLMEDITERIDLEYIFTNRLKLEKPNDEQICAAIFSTPSSALLLEKIEDECLERSARLALWLKSQIQSDDVDLREAIMPLMKAGIVNVEMVAKTAEMVFLVKDIFTYRAPPTRALQAAKESHPQISDWYEEQIRNFFSPPPPNKGYNPTIQTDNPNSPIMEDRAKIAKFLAESKYYEIIKCLREGPCSLDTLVRRIPFPKQLIEKALFKMMTERIIANNEEEGLWMLITDPRVDIFLPEFALKLIVRKYKEKDVSKEIALRHLDNLIEVWREAG